MPIPSVKEVAMGGKFPGYYLHVIHSIQTSYLMTYWAVCIRDVSRILLQHHWQVSLLVALLEQEYLTIQLLDRLGMLSLGIVNTSHWQIFGGSQSVKERVL